MSPPPRSVRAVRDARRILRDVAAAHRAVAAGAADRAGLAVCAAEAALDEHLDLAAAAMVTARSVEDLHEITASLDADRDDIKRAAVVAAKAAQVAAAATARLMTSERQLRTIEKVSEHIEEQRNRSDARSDQRFADDRNSRRGYE